MIIADEATGRVAPPMMGYRLHIPIVRPQVNGRLLMSVTSPCVVTMEALSGLATSHTRNISHDMLPDQLDRDNARMPLNSGHSSMFCLSKCGSPSHVLKNSDAYHTENPSYFRDKHV